MGGPNSNVRERLITLSRFELESDVIEHFIDDVESDILSNPYLISEWCARNFIEKVSTRTIDLGAFPDQQFRVIMFQCLRSQRSPFWILDALDH